jgi:hypothetical protein
MTVTGVAGALPRIVTLERIILIGQPVILAGALIWRASTGRTPSGSRNGPHNEAPAAPAAGASWDDRANEAGDDHH